MNIRFVLNDVDPREATKVVNCNTPATPGLTVVTPGSSLGS
jgi:hypothetical protein